MTVQEFKNKWIGRLIDYDGASGGQCFDVINQYILEMTGQKPIISLLKASDIYRKPQGIMPSSVRYERIANTIEAIPQAGDILVWDNANWNNNYGHTAVVLTANANGATVIQQDGLNPRQGCREVIWNFRTHNPIGWLRIKNNQININNNQTNNNIDDMATLHQSINTAIQDLQKTNPEAYDNWGRAIGNTDMAKQGKEPLVWVKEMVDQMTWKIQGRDVAITNLRNQLEEKEGQIEGLINTAPTVRDSPKTIKRLDELDQANIALTKQNLKLSEELDLLNRELQKKPTMVYTPSLNAEIDKEAFPELSTSLAWIKNNVTVITTILSGFGLTFSTDSVQQLVSAGIAIIGIVTSFYLEHIYKKTK